VLTKHGYSFTPSNVTIGGVATHPKGHKIAIDLAKGEWSHYTGRVMHKDRGKGHQALDAHLAKFHGATEAKADHTHHRTLKRFRDGSTQEVCKHCGAPMSSRSDSTRESTEIKVRKPMPQKPPKIEVPKTAYNRKQKHRKQWENILRVVDEAHGFKHHEVLKRHGFEVAGSENPGGLRSAHAKWDAYHALYKHPSGDTVTFHRKTGSWEHDSPRGGRHLGKSHQSLDSFLQGYGHGS
jgi:hypothetical protein